MHGETTSEKNAFGHYFDGKVSAILGTHTHIPTADAKILDGGTAYQTDVGMTGDYNSVIGMDKEVSINTLNEIYELIKNNSTSFNCQPLRVIFLKYIFFF